MNAGAVAIDTTTAQLQTTFDTKQLRIFHYGRTGVGNLQSQPAWRRVCPAQGGVGQGMAPAIAGQRPENNQFNLDGVSNNNYLDRPAGLCARTRRWLSSRFCRTSSAPEFGGASGGIFNAIVKSGTNTIHGSIYEYLQNRNLNAVDSLDWVAGIRRIRAMTITGWARPSAARSSRTSCSTSVTSNTTRLVSRGPRLAAVCPDRGRYSHA